MWAVFKKLPVLWQAIIAIALLGVVIGGGYWLVGGVQRWAYNRARAQFEQQKQEWMTERAKLLARAEDDERRIQELEPQVAAFQAAAEQGKKIDAEKAKEIQDVIERENAAQANADKPVDCRVRAQRVCDLFRATDRRFDCRTIFDQCKSAGQ